MNAKLFIKKNASTILTGLGTIGVVLTKWETVKIAGPSYATVIGLGLATMACIISADMLNQKKQASLISAYALLDQSYKEYKNKVKEIYGEEAHNEIINSIMIEKAEEIGVRGSYLGINFDLSLEKNDGESKIFYDGHSGRYFEATIEQVMNAEYHLNRNYILRGYSYLNEFYEFLGIEETDYGSVLGWAPNDDGMYWIDFNHRKLIMEDGLEVYIIEMSFEPTYDFLEY